MMPRKGAQVVVGELSGLALPRDWPETRHVVHPSEIQRDGYMDRYDHTTLIYDVCAAPSGRGVVVTCPRLFNLWPTLRAALPEKPSLFGHHRLRTSEHIFLRRVGPQLPISLGQETHPLPIRDDISQSFKGSNAVLFINKDNDLQWVREWAAYYVKAHGANAVFGIDNGSERYDHHDLAACLNEVPGTEAVAVFRAPYKFGPVQNRYKRQSSQFLQNAMMNMARLTTLAKARAVLQLDIDEIVLKKTPTTVFDAAARRRFHFVKIGGSWVFPAPGSQWPCPQKDSVFRAEPNQKCHDKWAARPESLLSWFGWDWHKVGDEASRVFKPDPRFELLHCRATTTGWRRALKGKKDQKLVRSDEIAADFAVNFSE